MKKGGTVSERPPVALAQFSHADLRQREGRKNPNCRIKGLPVWHQMQLLERGLLM